MRSMACRCRTRCTCGSTGPIRICLTPKDWHAHFKELVRREDEAARAAAWRADYWSIGPCYATANKSDAGPALGPEGFERLARRAPLGMPVIGIGGISATNAAAVIRAGAVGVAVIGAVMGAVDPEQAALAIRAMIPG